MTDKTEKNLVCKCAWCGLKLLWSRPTKPCTAKEHGMHSWKPYPARKDLK